MPPPEPPDDAQVQQAFEAMHRGVYEVYALPLERDALWERLDASFAGDALTAQYIEHWTARHQMDRDRTRIDVRRVDYDSVALLSLQPGSARVDASWSVGGIVTHQRHKHPRVNRYRAVYTMEDLPGRGWRIVQTRMRDVKRVRSPSRTDGVFDALDAMDAAPDGGGGFLDPLDLLEGGLGEDTGTAADTDASEPAP